MKSTPRLALAPLSAETFRQSLSAAVDLDRALSSGEQENIRQEAARLVVAYCLLFGQGLERKTLWSKIDSAMASACAKVDDDDLDRWIDLCLEHIRADPADVVRLRSFAVLRDSLRVRDGGWKRAFIRWVNRHRYTVLALGKDKWEQAKQEMQAARRHAGSQAKEAGAESSEIRQAAALAGEAALEEVQL